MNKTQIENRTIFCRDNLEILEGINSNSIDLIYLDPPFNKKKTFTAPLGSSAEGASFKDVFKEKDVKDEWVQTIKEDNEKLRTFLTGIKDLGDTSNFAYLAFMAIRVLEMYRVLKDTGSLYLHCDHTMSHYLKLMMDCIFGEKNFRNEIVWHYAKGHGPKADFRRKHDVILRYTKSKGYIFNKQKYEHLKNQKYRFNRVDEDKKAYRINHTRNKEGEYKRFYLDDGVAVDDIWSYLREKEYDQLAHNAKERTGYPTQKPLALLDRIIKASSNEGDIVLDPFCGCATTCVAAEGLNRKWIGIDVSVKAYELVKQRLAKELEKRYAVLYVPEVMFSTVPPKRIDTDTTVKEKKYVYIISNESYKDEYKVGIAKDWKSRLNSYQTADPNRKYKLEYKVLTHRFREIEKAVHDNFTNRHEWVRAELINIKSFIEKQIK